jgi:hypothetical protein
MHIYELRGNMTICNMVGANTKISDARLYADRQQLSAARGWVGRGEREGRPGLRTILLQYYCTTGRGPRKGGERAG